MKTRNQHKKYLAAISTSALAAGMAQGAVVYSYYNHTIVAGGNDSFTFDLNQDGTADYLIQFNNNNSNKPFVDTAGLGGTNMPFVLSDLVTSGLPLTTYGALIDPNYQSSQAKAWFYQNGDANVVGEWNSQGTDLEGYVGLLIIDQLSNTRYGWAHFIYNSATVVNGVTGTLTLVDAAMETESAVGITCGQTAEAGQPPVVVVQPSSQTTYVGANIRLTGAGTGNPNPAYQWKAGAPGSGVYTNLTDGSGIVGSTNHVLTISNVTAAADYVLNLTNANGVANSSIAKLTVAPLLITGLTPTPAQAYQGSTLNLNAAYLSSVPVSFQWRKGDSALTDDGRISGTTSATLVLRQVTAADAGNYSVVITNVYGAVTSSVDPLTVVVPTTAYEAALISLAPVSYYRLNEAADPAQGGVVAYDLVGGLNGIFGTEVQNGNSKYGIAGPRPTDGYPGFEASNTAMLVGPTAKSLTSFVNLPAPNLNTNTVTFTAWIYPAQPENNWNVILSYRGTVSGTANGLNYQGSSTHLGYHWNDQGGSYNWDSTIAPPEAQWSLVALTVSPTEAVMYMFNTSGMSVATNVFAHTVQAFNTAGHIGGDNNDPSFVGDIDEVAIFNRTLSADELARLYSAAAAVTLKMERSNADLVLTWPEGTLLQAPSLSGPWTTNSATSPFTTTPTGSGMFYRVIVR